jgi:molybdopterin converting factor small subunit
MLNVNVEVMSWLKEDFGHEGSDRFFIKESVAEGYTIMDLLHKLARKYPIFAKKAFALEPKVTFDYCAIIRNGEYLPTLSGLDAELKDGDTVKLNPSLYGG